MKIIIFIFLILMSLSFKAQYSENFKEQSGLKGPIQLSDDIQSQILVKKIMNDYGKSFKYFDELQKGLFKFEIKDKHGYFLSILNNRNAVMVSFHLYKEKFNNLYSLVYKQDEIEKFVDKTIFKQREINFFKNNDVIENLFVCNNILNDQIIIHVPEYRDFKVFNRSVALEHLIDQDGEACPLYELLADAKILPYYDSSISEYIPKVVSVDPRKHNILYGDQNYDILCGDYVSKFYCTQGNDYNELSNPTGITFGKVYNSGNYSIYPIYVADQHNSRIIKSNFKIENGGDGASFFDDNSFEIVSRNVHLPYDVEFFETSTGSNDKIWVSENYYNGSLVCLNSNGTINKKIKGYRYAGQYTVPFQAGANIRMALYKPMNCFAFIYSIAGTITNEICTFLLNEYGEPLSMANDTIVDVWREHFNSDYPLTSVNFQNVLYGTVAYPNMWVTTGGFSPPSPYSNMVHIFAINTSANFGYFGSTGLPRNSDWYFHNLLNTSCGLGYYDLFTIEEWSDVYGLRKYYPFADYHSVLVTNYCDDSTDLLYWNGVLTNDCWIRVTAERKVNDTQWEPVEIKQIDGFAQPPGTFDPVIFRLKGYTAATWEDPIEIKLKLPLKDYLLGGRVKIKAKLFPEYIYPNNSNDYTYREDEVDIQKTCLPRPGGCPFLYVTDTNKDYIADNNILHRSEFGTEGDITDKYKLRIIPYTTENYVELSLVENENDYGYINMVKLYAVDYPTNKKMAITEDNQIVLYDSATVLASDSVTLNERNITSRVNFHNPDTISVIGYTNDQMFSHFTNPDLRTKLRNAKNNSMDSRVPRIREDRNDRLQGNDNLRGQDKKGNERIDYERGKNYNIAKTDGGTPDPVAFIANLSNLNYPTPGAKYYAGQLTATSIFSNQVQKQFARRELSSVMVLPLFNDTDKVDNINFTWQSDFQMKYLGVTNSLQYSGFTFTEAPMSEGKYITSSNETNIIDNLLYIDDSYGEVSSAGLIKMKFDIRNIPALNEGYKRDYVIEVNGRYYRGGDSRLSNVKPNEVPLTFKLSQNYPNPFNPVTKIKFEIPKTSKVNIVIYNILGQEVKRLLNNEIKDAGRYEVEFDATNYASGVYFYRIEVRQAGSSTVDFVQSKKMVLVK